MLESGATHHKVHSGLKKCSERFRKDIIKVETSELVLKAVHHLTNVHEHGQSRTFRSLYTLGEDSDPRKIR